MRKDRICIAIPVLSLRHHGGIRILIEISNKISDWASVDFLVPKGYVNTNYKINPRVGIIEISAGQLPKYLTYLVFLFRLLPRLAHYDLLVANFFVTYFSVFAASRIFRKKMIYLVQDIESKYRTIFGKVLNLFCELTYRSTSIITANPYLEEEIRARDSKPLSTFTVGVSEIFFLQPRNSNKEYDVIYFARRESWKNLGLFLEFLVHYRKSLTVAVVSQDAELLEKIRSMTFRHRIFLMKPVGQSQLVDIIDCSRIMLSTSLREGFSLPPLEAMARGLPVVLYPSGGPSLYVRDGFNALYFRTLDEMEERIELLLSNNRVYSNMSQNATETAAKYSLTKELYKLSMFLRENFT